MKRLLLVAVLSAGCPAIYHPNQPDSAVAFDLASSDFSAEEPLDLTMPRVDPCAGVCAPGETCVAGCLPLEDACRGVHCAGLTSCLDGACVPGCVLDRCTGVTCAAGFRCARDGRCVARTVCDWTCPDGAACAVECLPADICDGVVCDAHQSCVRGSCVDDPCAGLTCPLPTLCVDGACVDSCHPPTPSGEDGGCDSACSLGRVCAFGACRVKLCQPSCGCLEDCVDGQCVQTCVAPSLPCACDCCPPAMACGGDGHCHGMIP